MARAETIYPPWSSTSGLSLSFTLHGSCQFRALFFWLPPQPETFFKSLCQKLPVLTNIKNYTCCNRFLKFFLCLNPVRSTCCWIGINTGSFARKSWQPSGQDRNRGRERWRDLLRLIQQVRSRGRSCTPGPCPHPQASSASHPPAYRAGKEEMKVSQGTWTTQDQRFRSRNRFQVASSKNPSPLYLLMWLLRVLREGLFPSSASFPQYWRDVASQLL